MTNFKTTKIKDLEENKIYNGIYLIKDINERLTKKLRTLCQRYIYGQLRSSSR